MLEFIATLGRHEVRYLMVGGYAVFFHGYPRSTADIDFGYDPSPENARRLYAALVEFWGGTPPVVESVDELAQPGMVFQFGKKPNRIDLLSRIDGIEFEVAWQRRIDATIDSRPALIVHVISLRDLRLAKAAAGRARDLDDLEHLPDDPR